MTNILVCHTGAWIGDMVLLTPALRAIKRAFPESFLTFLLRQQVEEMMNRNPYVDRCFVDPKAPGRLRSYARLHRQLHSEEFDIAVVLHPTSIRNVILPFLARVPIRVGSNNNGRGILLTKSCPNFSGIHEIERYLAVVNALNQEVKKPTAFLDKTKSEAQTELEYWHTETDRQSIKALLKCEGVSSEDKLIAINLGTTWETKQWSMRKYDIVIKEISDIFPSFKIILTGSEAERALVDELTQTDSTVNLVGKTDIVQLGALLERAEVCLTCDSGPMHIAAAVGTPTIALFGPTDPIRHRPFGKGHTVIEKPIACRPCYQRTCQRKDTQFLCMQEINASEVVKELVNNTIFN